MVVKKADWMGARHVAGDTGRQELFEQICERNRRRLWSLARYYAPGDEAPDLHQEILLELWKSLDGFQGRSQVDTWVYRVALNTAMTMGKRATLRASRTSSMDPAAVNLPANPSLDGGRAILTDFSSSLGHMDRAILHLYLENLTPGEMSEITGLSEGNLRVRLSRIKKRYKERYLEA